MKTKNRLKKLTETELTAVSGGLAGRPGLELPRPPKPPPYVPTTLT